MKEFQLIPATPKQIAAMQERVKRIGELRTLANRSDSPLKSVHPTITRAQAIDRYVDDSLRGMHPKAAMKKAISEVTSSSSAPEAHTYAPQKLIQEVTK